MHLTREIEWQKHGAAVVHMLEPQGLEAVGNLTSKLSTETTEANSYPELDMALPLHWESLTGKGHKSSKSSDSQDFEFNMSGLSVDSSDYFYHNGISPADDLFFKGQLLPLHLPKRLQMVQKLSSPRHCKEGDSSPVTVSCFFQPTGLKYSPLGSDEGYLGSALVNSRCSSFHSQGSTNFWESDSHGELDSGDSSSSRDSSGSSQDACPPLSEKLSVPMLDKNRIHVDNFDNVSLFRQEEDSSFRSEKSLFSSWLRTPLKWKVLFGLKKPAKVEVLDNFNKKCVVGPAKSLNTAGENVTRIPRPGTYFSGEQKLSRKASLDESERSRGGFSCPESIVGVSWENEREYSGSTASKGRESLHRYLSILKPVTINVLKAKTGCREEASADSKSRTVDIRGLSFSGNLSTCSLNHRQASIPAPATSPSSIASPSNPRCQRSSPAVSSRSRCKSPTKPSFAGNLRIPSLSWNSKVSANSNSVTYPNCSGLFNHNSSTMAELHSAIQGAIAHCKQSELQLI